MSNFKDLFGITPEEFKDNVGKMEQSVNALSGAFDKLGKNIESNVLAEVKALKKEIEGLSITEDDARKKLLEYEKALSKTTKSHEDLQKELTDLKKQLAAAKQEVSSLEKETKQYDKTLEKSNKTTKKSKENLVELATRYLRTTVVVTQLYQGLRTLQMGVNNAFDSFVTLNKELQFVRSIAGATDDEFKILTMSAKNLGATTEFTASQIANLQKELAKLGFTTNEIVNATASIVDLATATGEDLVSSARVAASTLRAFNLEAVDMARVTDTMAGAFVRSGLNLEKFSESMKFVAPIAKQLNIDVEATTLFLSQLADAGLRGTQAGTALRNLFSDLATPTSKLAQRIGFTVESTDDLIRAFRMLQDESIGLTEAAQLVDKTAMQQFAIFVDQATAIQDLEVEYRKLHNEGRRLAFMMRDTLSNDLEITNSVLDSIGRGLFTFADGFGRAGQEGSNFRDTTQGLNSYLQTISDQLDRVNQEGASFGDVITAIVVPAIEELLGLPLMQFFGVNFSNAANDLKRVRTETELAITSVEAMRTLQVKKQNELAEATTAKNTKQIANLSAELSKLNKDIEEQSEVLSINMGKKEFEIQLIQEETKNLKDLSKELTGYNYEVTSSLGLSTGLTQAQENRLKFLDQEQARLETSIDVFRQYNIVAKESKELFLGGGEDVVINNIQLLKAQADAELAQLERIAQLQDRTFVDQAKTAKEFADRRIKLIDDVKNKELELLEEQRSTLIDTEYQNRKITIQEKANAETIRERIKLENTLINIRKRRADLINRESAAELASEIKANQLIKDNTLNRFEDIKKLENVYQDGTFKREKVLYKGRLSAARDYYVAQAALITLEEDKALAALAQAKADGIIMEEEEKVQRLEIQEQFFQRRLERNQQAQLELFRMEQEMYLQNLRFQQQMRDEELRAEQASNQQRDAQMRARINAINIEKNTNILAFGLRKKLIEEERDLRLQQLTRNASIQKQELENNYQDELELLKQNLRAGTLSQDQYNKQRLQKTRTFNEELSAANQNLAADIEQINTDAGQQLVQSWSESFEEVLNITQQFADVLFDFLGSKREAELAQLKAWEDARLEYVKGNAEAEALVRLQAEERRKEIERKQTKDARAKALFDIAVNTAVAISRVPAEPGGIFAAPVLIALITALGAAQAAAVLAAPLPEFYKGTQNAPEGLAKVDERGQELIYRKKRNTLELGSHGGERITYLERGDKVFTASQTKNLLNNGVDLLASNNHIDSQLNGKAKAEGLVLKATDEDKIVRGIINGMRTLPQSDVNVDGRGISKYVRKGMSRTQILNKRFKF